MKPVPMKFGEYVWHHNPQNISFECDRNIPADALLRKAV